MGFFKKVNMPIEGEGFWRSQGFVPLTSNEQGIKWVSPDELYRPEDAFKRWGNDINPLKAIFQDARESVLNALAKYVWNTKDKKIKLGFEITWHDSDIKQLVYLHFREIRLNHYICEVVFEESNAIPDPLDDEADEPEQRAEAIEDIPLSLIAEIIDFIHEKSKDNGTTD